MSFRSKLARLEGSSPERLPPSAGPPSAVLDDLRARIRAVLERTSVRSAPAPDVPPCELPFVPEPTERGPLHVRTLFLPACHRTGRIPVAAARDARGDLLALLALDPSIARCDPARALFLDTETTGLAGGAGTVPFLVGLAFWQAAAAGGGGLVLEQLFVHALGQEEPVLERVRRRIEEASLLVTFNGKSFDLPLLRARYVMSRLPAPVEPPHLDLLHVARRIHGRRVARGCRLVTLEDDVLGFVREGDIESRDVAACYLHYVRTGDPRALLGVVEHNAWDVVAMAALMGLYGEPLNGELGANDLAGVARTLRRAGALDRASLTADAAVERGGTAEALRARADIAKARGDRARALADFEALADGVDDPSVRLELAKLYEHWVKEPARALEWAAQGTGEAPDRATLRVTRLARKVAASPHARAKRENGLGTPSSPHARAKRENGLGTPATSSSRRRGSRRST